MKEDQLKEIVSELLTRPGHEKVRGNLLRLLTDGLGASSTDITFEQQLNRFRVRGRIIALLGRREKKDADRQLGLYIRDREAALAGLSRHEWRAVQLYMRAKGKIAFVMPYAAMTRKPFALFRKGSVDSGAKRNRFKRSGFERLCQAL